MNIPYIRGVTARQAHVGIPDGTVEEEYARNGFFGKYAHFYRTEAPTGWTRIEGSLRPRAYDLREPLAERRPLLHNADVRIHSLSIEREMDHYFRNADADELYFIHRGQGEIETDFGPLAYRPGDYLLIPRGTVYRLIPGAATHALLIESASEYRLPDKGMLGEHALFDPSVIEVPSPTPRTAMRNALGECEVRVQRAGELTSIFYPFNPLNAVGWKGTLAVTRLNVADIRPLSCDRYHLPPSAHTTFLANGFVVCTFLPRPLENGDPTALKVPFYHSNIDFDEVLFYHSGEFFSREGIKPGMLTFHPQGIHHGPQPGAVERSKGAQRTEEVAVMIDTLRPLNPDDSASARELPEYWKSWKKSGVQAP